MSNASQSARPEVALHLNSWRLAILLVLAGCSVPAQTERTPAKPAQVTLVNRTDYIWQISLTGAGTPSVTRVEAKRTVTFVVPGGHYRIQQLILNQTQRPTLPRSFSADLGAGKRYEWPLITLQSSALPDPS